MKKVRQKLSDSGILVINKGYLWDGVSGPTWDTKSTMIPGLVHDAFYQAIRLELLPLLFKEEVDTVFYETLIQKNVNFMVDHTTRLNFLLKTTVIKGKEITMLEWFKSLSKKSAAVVAIGTCATYGGIPAANPNPTNSKGVGDILKESRIKVPYINVSGCPPHPDWMAGTIAHVLLYGIPELDELKRPKLFYGKLIHDNCPYRSYFDEEQYAKRFSDSSSGEIWDIGTKTMANYRKVIYSSKTLVVNGPMGVYEVDAFSLGTKYVLESIANCDAYSLVGGGHTINAINSFNIKKDYFSYISLSGKAMIEYLQGKDLPGLISLYKQVSQKPQPASR